MLVVVVLILDASTLPDATWVRVELIGGRPTWVFSV